MSRTLNQLAREEMKLALLGDLLKDANVCKIEGWSTLDYLIELQDMINERIAVVESAQAFSKEDHVKEGKTIQCHRVKDLEFFV